MELLEIFALLAVTVILDQRNHLTVLQAHSTKTLENQREQIARIVQLVTIVVDQTIQKKLVNAMLAIIVWLVPPCLINMLQTQAIMLS